MNNGIPKYQWLAEWIKREILDKKLLPGDKLYTENELANMFSLSRHTVRQAISILENEGTVTRSRGSGTYISSVRSSRPETKTIGVITTYISDYIFPHIIQGIDSCLMENGYTMQLGITYNKPEVEAAVIKGLLERGVDGLIIEPSKSALPNTNSQLYMQIEKSGIPCVMINGYYPGSSFPVVATDDKDSGCRAVELAIQYGHKNIAGIFKSDDIQGHLRYLGYSEGLQKHFLSLKAENVLWYVTEDMNDIFSGAADSLVLKRLNDCSAVVCYNDQIAVMLIELLKRNNIDVPKDMSIVSFDDSSLSALVVPGLTTFAHPKEILGNEAALQIINIINGKEPCTGKRFTPDLVQRSSLAEVPPSQV